MKKLFTLIAAAMMAVGANAQSEVDIPLSLDSWGWGWSCDNTMEGNILVGTLTGAYGAISTGWDDGADWSKYSKICVDIESYDADWGKIYFSTSDDTYKPEQSFSTITSKKTVILNFEGEKATSVKQFAIQGKAAGNVIKVSRVYLVENVEYGEGQDIEFDEWGNITSDKFAGYSDGAKVEFTVEATGEATKEGQSVIGWGIGTIKSLDQSVTVGDLGLKQIGDNVYTFTVGELKEALLAPKNEYDMQGINWNVYNQGNATCKRKSVKIFEVKGYTGEGFQPTGIRAINAEKNVNAPIYNLSGQRVDAQYKGVVIQNGKKFLQK